MPPTAFLDDALRAFATAFSPLRAALGDVEAFRLLLADFGWELDSSLDEATFVTVQQIFTAEIALLDTLEDADAVSRAASIPALITSLYRSRTLQPSWPTPLDADSFWTGTAADPPFLRELVDALLWNALAQHAGPAFGVLRFIGVFREELRPAMPAVGTKPSRAAYVRRVLDWDQFAATIADPVAAFASVYRWGSADQTFRATELLRGLAALFEWLPVTAAVVETSDAIYDRYYDRTANTSPVMLDQLTVVPLIIRSETGSPLVSGRLSLNAVPLPAIGSRTGDPVGFSLFPLITGRLGRQVDLGEGVTLTLNGEYSAVPVIAEIRPSGVIIDLPLGPLSTLAAEARVDAQANGAPWRLFGSATGTRIEMSRAHLALNVTGPATDVMFGIEGGIDDASLVLAFSEGDSFLRGVFGSGSQRAALSLIIRWSNREGFSIQGQTTLTITMPVHQTLFGAITIETITLVLSIDAAAGRIMLMVALSAGFELGPLTGSVDRVGLDARFKPVSDGSGNLGLVDVDLGFKSPRAVGLAVDAGGISGGGYLAYDEIDSRYAGVLELSFGEIGLVAIGLITTKLPEEGYALLVNIGVTFTPPIQLPYNFNLSGVGGLLALNRTMDLETLRSGVRNKTLDSILFPEDPILNANKIINDCETVFPIDPGRFVVAPMLKCGWGANSIIQADLAIALDLPEPVTVAILGQFTAKFPKSDDAKVVIHLDVLGVVEFAKKLISIDATLYDSKILTYDLSGDSALRLNWGSTPVFAMSLGGFHPKFSPPPNFPKLRRLKLQLRSTSSFDLSCTVYHALTSNSLQIGANLELHAEACGASLDGHVSFDTLFIFSPSFEFEAGISGHVAARYKGHDIASVHISLDLSGPTPWNAKGRAKVSVLCWDVTARFNKTWGSDEKARLAAVDPWEDFQTEVANTSNWGAAPLPRRSAVEALISMEGDVDPSTLNPRTPPDLPHLLAHPAGGLEVRQRFVPLALKLERFGNADVTGHYTFDLKLEFEELPAGPELETVEIKEHFALGQSKALSKSDRLSKPSYEKLKAGVLVRPTLPRLDGAILGYGLEYESILIAADGVSTKRFVGSPKWSVLKRSLARNARQLVPFRNRGSRRFSVSGGSPRVSVTEEAFVIVDKSTLTRAAGIQYRPGRAGEALTQTEAQDVLNNNVAAGVVAPGAAMVVPAFEEAQA